MRAKKDNPHAVRTNGTYRRFRQLWPEAREITHDADEVVDCCEVGDSRLSGYIPTDEAFAGMLLLNESRDESDESESECDDYFDTDECGYSNDMVEACHEWDSGAEWERLRDAIAGFEGDEDDQIDEPWFRHEEMIADVTLIAFAGGDNKEITIEKYRARIERERTIGYFTARARESRHRRSRAKNRGKATIRKLMMTAVDESADTSDLELV